MASSSSFFFITIYFLNKAVHSFLVHSHWVDASERIPAVSLTSSSVPSISYQLAVRSAGSVDCGIDLETGDIAKPIY